jgi:phage gp16-like protein
MKSALPAIHVGLKQLGIGDDDKRALYLRVTGKDRLTEMQSADHDKVLRELRRLGFKSDLKRPNGRRKMSGKFAKKLQALWIAGWNLGIVKLRDDAALEAFVTRQTGISSERFLHHASDAARVIEALKKWMEREAKVDWSDSEQRQPYRRADGYRIARAQWAMICPARHNDFWPEVTTIAQVGKLQRDLTGQQWIEVMNAFGERVRQSGRKAVAA